MLGRLIDSHWAFRTILALPAIGMLLQFLRLHSWGLLLDQSGEWAVRMLIATLAVSPVRLVMKQLQFGPSWPMWLFKRRRDLGMACFLYAALHLAVYLVRQSNLNVVLFDMWFREYATGWIAFITMLVLAVTSNDRSIHALGLWWKPLQRLVYVSVVAAALHSPIVYPAAPVVGPNAQVKAAKAFLDLLSGDQGQAILRQHGFAPPP